MEQVILVNDKDEYVGVIEKMQAHREALLHRAFSVFIFNDDGEMLLQRRAEKKYHSGGLWTNTCCSHPRPQEQVTDAAARRLKEEMGFTCELKKLFDFTYRSELNNGLTEFEFDHVLGGFYNGIISYNEDEVDDYKYVPLSAIQKSIANEPYIYTAWFVIAFPMVQEWLQKHPDFF